MKTIKLLIMSVCAMVAATACSKKNEGGGTAAVTYYLSNNVCYDAKTNQSVASTNCNSVAYYFVGSTCYATATRAVTDMANCHALVGQYFYLAGNNCFDKNTNAYTTYSNCNLNNTANGRYQWRNNICIDTQTGWSAQESLCLTGNNGGNDPRCLQRGRYVWVDSRGVQYSVDCNYTNCTGQVFYDLSTRTHVTCQ